MATHTSSVVALGLLMTIGAAAMPASAHAEVCGGTAPWTVECHSQGHVRTGDILYGVDGDVTFTGTITVSTIDTDGETFWHRCTVVAGVEVNPCQAGGIKPDIGQVFNIDCGATGSGNWICSVVH